MINRTQAPLYSARVALAATLIALLVSGALQTSALHARDAPPYRSTAGAPVSPSPPSCDGPHDFIVDGGKTTITGTQRFDRVCVVDGGVLRASGTLRAGVLYADAMSRISADGVPGGGMPDECGDQSSTEPDGADGSALHILAWEAIVRGSISADGGGGLDAVACSTPIYNGGRGGRGGRLTLDIVRLILSAPLSALGGDGGLGYYGDGTPGHSTEPDTDSPGGNGGDGGVVIVRTGQPVSPHMAHLLQVSGGAGGEAGVKGRYPDGKAGHAGHTFVATLTRTQQLTLPRPPPSLVTTLRVPPVRLPAQPDSVFTRGMRCGKGDLRVTADQDISLTGLHRYPHVCVYKGGIIEAGPQLTLQAQTIMVQDGGNILAGAAVGPMHGRPQSGRYESGGPCAANATAPHAGIPGAPSREAPPGGDPLSGAPPVISPGGDGGGAITLQASRLLLAGALSVNGGDGAGGQDAVAYGHGYFGPWPGSGGGSGGGILVVAGQLQLRGTISATGGAGGHSNSYVAQGRRATRNTADADTGYSAESGPHGGPGCIKLLVETLRAPAADLPVAGPTLIGRP